MGCCESSNSKFTFETYCDKMKVALEVGSLSSMSFLIRYAKKKLQRPSIIDEEIIKINNISLNPLGFSLFTGNLEAFKYLLDNGGSLIEMEKLLEKSKVRLINVICYKGYVDFLSFYLPTFLSSYTKKQELIKSFTIDLKDSIVTRRDFDLAIHSACRAGMLNIVSYLYKYFKDLEYCPKEFDIYSKDECYGEDASLIACRSGSFGLVKMLYEICKMDFKTINSNNENAIMVCVSGFNSNPSYSYFEILQYLVDVVGIDITYMYEELLILAEGQEMVKYIEKELEKREVRISRQDLPKSYIGTRKIDRANDNQPGPLFTKEIMDFITTTERTLGSTISAVGNHTNQTMSTFLSTS